MDNKDNRIKKLYYRSNNRGWKETDIILSKFAEQYLHSLTNDQLDEYEKLLNESDVNIFAWFTNKEAPPTQYINILHYLLYGRSIDQ